MTTLAQLSSSQVSPEFPINENFDALSAAAVFGKKNSTSSGITWGYYGGIWGGLTVADGTLTLATSGTNYLVVNRATGVISTSTTTTNWLDTGNYARVYKITTSSSAVTAIEDHRAGDYGVLGPQPLERQQDSVSAAYTFALSDRRRTKLHPSADTTARTWTIPANASVAFPIGSELEVINQNAAGVLTIAITTDTMRLSPGGTTGSRTLAANGWARIRKITATEWIISGTGLT